MAAMKSKKSKPVPVGVPAAIAAAGLTGTSLPPVQLPGEDARALKGWMSDVNKNYGAGTVIAIANQPGVLRISTGVFELDAALGGGFPIGRVALVWGQKAAGKSTLCGLVAAQAQRLDRFTGLPLGTGPGCSPLPLAPVFRNKKGDTVAEAEAVEVKKTVDPENAGKQIEKRTLKDGFSVTHSQAPMRVLVVNQEGVLDPRWTKFLGVTNEEALALNTETGEQTQDIVNSAMANGLVDLVIVDSIASMTPMAEAEASAEDAQRAAQARLVNKAMRVWVATLNSFKDRAVRPTIVLVNQERIDTNVQQGRDPRIKPGGKGQEFANAVEILLSRGSVVKEQDISDEGEGEHLLLTRTNYKIVRNKTFPPGSIGQYMISVAPHKGYTPGNIIQEKQVLEAAQRYGIIKSLGKDGKGGPYALGKKEFRTLKEIMEWARTDKADFEAFRRAFVEYVVKKRAGIDGAEFGT